MGRKERMAKKAHKIMNRTENIRNIGIAAHIDHGKTTLSDNLVYGAGLMSGELAGQELVMDTMEEEQERGITIENTNTSMVYEYDDDEYLVNLIDTPGHVDFGGEVTRAMRAVDGCIIVVGAVEGIMPQTETVVRQALKEKVKPILYINKVDRLITELQVDEKELQQRLIEIIKEVNQLIKNYAPTKELAKEWQMTVEEGSVAFGSALYNWGISKPYMEKTGITFKDIYKYLKEENQKELAKESPVHPVILDMVVKHLPNPKKSQKYRIPEIWKGDPESEEGKMMRECDKNGKLIMLVTSLQKDPHVGQVATARIYSGTVKEGQNVKLLNTHVDAKIQQVSVSMEAGRKQLKNIPAGNIAALTGIGDSFSGETVSEIDMVPFESIEHHSDPVVTKSIEPENPKDLPKLIKAMREIEKEDPTISVDINEETGEYRLSGQGELHLEITEERIRKYKKVKCSTSQPIVVYREKATEQSQELKPKTPNRHNQFVIQAEPLEEGIAKALQEGEIEQKIKDKKKLAEQLREHGMDKKLAKNVWSIKRDNMLVDASKGVQYLNEAKDLIVQAFEEAVEEGPLAREKLSGTKILIKDASLHEDAVHRGPAQVIPTLKKGIKATVLLGKPKLLEPKKKIYIDAPQDFVGEITKDIRNRRGEVENMKQEGRTTKVITKVPVAETFGFSSDIRSITQGKALWSQEYYGYEPLPNSLQREKIRQIRKRKGLKEQIPKPSELI
ncbi:MAG: elongation factor EF-2 [archaeon]